MKKTRMSQLKHKTFWSGRKKITLSAQYVVKNMMIVKSEPCHYNVDTQCARHAHQRCFKVPRSSVLTTNSPTPTPPSLQSEGTSLFKRYLSPRKHLRQSPSECAPFTEMNESSSIAKLMKTSSVRSAYSAHI